MGRNIPNGKAQLWVSIYVTLARSLARDDAPHRDSSRQFPPRSRTQTPLASAPPPYCTPKHRCIPAISTKVSRNHSYRRTRLLSVLARMTTPYRFQFGQLRGLSLSCLVLRIRRFPRSSFFHTYAPRSTKRPSTWLISYDIPQQDRGDLLAQPKLFLIGYPALLHFGRFYMSCRFRFGLSSMRRACSLVRVRVAVYGGRSGGVIRPRDLAAAPGHWD